MSGKGIWQQIQESKVTSINREFTKEDLEDIKSYITLSLKDSEYYRKNRLKEIETNRKALVKKSKELGKQIPLELAYHCYLTYNKTYIYISSLFLEKYKEWL